MNKKILLENNYKKYEQPKDEPILYQKKISNKDGIKYFINCYHYIDFSMDSWEYKIQVETKAGTIKITLFNSEVTIKELELFFESTWKNYGAYYYEEFEARSLDEDKVLEKFEELEEAIKNANEYQRCPELCEGCIQCDFWKNFDKLKKHFYGEVSK